MSRRPSLHVPLVPLLPLVPLVATSLLVIGCGADVAACPPLPWTRLELGVSKFLVLKGRVEVRAESVPSADVALHAFEPGEAGGVTLRELGGDCAVVLEARADSTVTRPVRTREILDAASGGVVQQEEEKARDRLKIRRFGTGGAAAFITVPSGEEGFGPCAPADGGEVRAEPWPDSPVGALPLTAGHSLLHQVAAARLDREGASASHALWSHGELVRLDLRAAERVERGVDYRRREGDGDWQRVEGRVGARRVVVEATPVGPEADAGSVDVLGMHGDVEIFVEIGTGLPLAVVGEVDALGRLAVELREAELPARETVSGTVSSPRGGEQETVPDTVSPRGGEQETVPDTVSP